MIDIKICEECFNYDCPTPCPATDSQKISCIKRDMIYRLKDEFDFDFENPKSYKKLASRKSEQIRAIYKEYTDMLHLDASKPLYTHDGKLIATSFERLVIGDYGAYIEYDLSQVPQGVRYYLERGQEYRTQPYWRNRVKYIWYTIPDSKPHIKIYWQLRTVTYADYKRKKFYISPFEIMQHK